MRKFLIFLFAVMLGSFTLATPAPAITVLDFEGLQDDEEVEEYYNGGFGAFGSGPGPSFGVSFTSVNQFGRAEASIDFDVIGLGGGNFGGEPSPDTALTLFAQDTMNVPGGFTTGFSLFYSDPRPSSLGNNSIEVWDGLDGTGNLLATLNLAITPVDGAPDPTGAFSPFVPIGVNFGGTARSVIFDTAGSSYFADNMTLGSSVPFAAPEPSTMLLLATGLVGLAGFRRKFRN